MDPGTANSEIPDLEIVLPDGRPVSEFMEEEADGQVEGLAQFKDEVICRIASDNVNRLEWILPPDLVNQFIVGSGDMQFRL